MASGKGTRLGLGTKSLIMYKKRLILEYLLESCVQAGITHIVVTIIPKTFERKIEKIKLERLKLLIQKYPNIKFIRGNLDSNTRRGPNDYRRYLDQKKAFYFLCGQSPQSSLFLRKLATLYKKDSIVVSGYRHRYGCAVSIGKSRGNKIKSFKNIKCATPKNFKVSGKNHITEFPYILNFSFYDKFVKKDGFKDIIELYPSRFSKNGGTVYFAANPIDVPEVDYPKEFPGLLKSINLLIKKNYRV